MNKQNRSIYMIVACALSLLLSGPAIATDSDDGVVGVAGFDLVEAKTCICVWVPLEQDEALSGVRWYNNDGTVVFPKVYLTGGDSDGPGLLAHATLVREAVQGGNSAWSQVLFDESCGSDNGGLYVILQFPFGSVQVAEGEGGGAGVGYKNDGTGLAGWLTLEGELWDRLHPSYGFAVEGIKEERDIWTVVLEQAAKSLPSNEPDSATDFVELRTVLLSPQPNPFNPKTDLRFVLEDAGRVDLEIYDLQGRLVKTLAHRQYSAGEHVLPWHGRDDSGREVSSGVYLARIVVGHYTQTHRLVLVR